MTSYIHQHACSGIVTVMVGPEETPFFFHESILCEKSPWFRAQLHSQMAEGIDSAVELSPIEISFRDFQQIQRKVIHRYDDDVHSFNQFFNWIYGHVYAIPRHDPEMYDPVTHVWEWIMLHTLAVELGVMDLADRALWEYVHCRDNLRTGYWVPLRSEIQFIYNNRVPTNDLRNLIVEKVRSLLFSMRFDSTNNQLSTLCLAHPTFTADVFQEIRQHPDQANHCNQNDCSMHTFHNSNTSTHTSPEYHFEVESPPHESEYLDDISDLALDGAAPSLVSDCGTISPEEEDACSELGRNEAIMEYYESRDMVIPFDRADARSILN